MTDLAFSEWRLLRLTLDRVGPFQDEVTTFNFLGVSEEGGPAPDPASLYMLLAKNGQGKTTVLESIHGLFGLLSEPVIGRFADHRAPGRAQADIRATWTLDGVRQTVLLSLWTGAPTPLVEYDSKRLREEAQVEAWASLGLLRSVGGVTGYDATNELGHVFFRAVKDALGSSPGGLWGATQEMPTVLLFPADRTLVAPVSNYAIERPSGWNYQPAQTFGADGPEWTNSLDNLLVWLDWLNDGRLEQLIDYLNEVLFKPANKVLRTPRRDELQAFISTTAGAEHPLYHLSHGERALLQLYVRAAVHMTRNTIILIDEIETHLHSTWLLEMLSALKQLLVGDRQLQIIFTTHNRELIRVFDQHYAEPGIVKGGYLIEDEIG